jgi:hypothetical protein
MLLVINGCDKDDEIVYNNVNNYYDVTFNNLEYDKYITSITIREVTHGTGEWGPNQLDDTIWGRQSWTITMQEGVYDFKILMEDSLYYYTATESNVIVDGNITLNVCYDCKNMVFSKEKKAIPDSRPVQRLQYKKVIPKKVYKGL